MTATISERPQPSARDVGTSERREGFLRRATVVVLALAYFTMPWQGVLFLPVIGNVSRTLSMALVAAGGLSLLLEGRRRRWLDAHVLMGALAVWSMLSVLWSISPEVSFGGAVDVFQLSILAVLTWEFAGTRERISILAAAFLLGALVAAGIVVNDYFQNRDVESVARYATGTLHPNDLAFIVALAVPIAWYLATTLRNPLLATAARCFVPLGLFTVVLTASRAGLVVVLLAMLVIPWTFAETPVPVRLALSAIGIGCMLLLPSLLPDAQVDRLSTVSSEIESGDIGGRSELWSAAANSFGDHPVTGVGVAASRYDIGEQTGRVNGAHNTFLSVAAELGIVGLGLFALILLAVFRRSARAQGVGRKVALVLAVVLLVGLQVRHWEYRLPLWAVLALLLNISAPAEPSLTREGT